MSLCPTRLIVDGFVHFLNWDTVGFDIFIKLVIGGLETNRHLIDRFGQPAECCK